MGCLFSEPVGGYSLPHNFIDVTTVNKFPSKLAHAFNKLSSRWPTSTYPNWFCDSQVLDVTGIITKVLGQSLSTPHSNVMACRSTFSSLKCLLGSTTQPKAAVSCISCKMPRAQKTNLWWFIFSHNHEEPEIV